MSFLRPELAETLRRRAEPLCFAALALGLGWLGLRAWGRADPMMATLWGAGALFCLVGALVTFRRSGFLRPATGPGMVTIAERRIRYMTGTGGGTVDLDLLQSLSVVPGGRSGLWRIVDRSGTVLVIPPDAAGAGQLYDALAYLPGIDWAKVLYALDNPPERILRVWEKDR